MKPVADENNRPRFIVDNNAGKVARWLRIMGFDSVFYRGGPDSGLIERAMAERRILLTRDTRIFKRRVITGGAVQAILLKDDDPEKQVQQVIGTLHLGDTGLAFTRCLDCNVQLIHVTPEEIKDLVPPFVFQIRDVYRQCPGCKRVFWRGSHRLDMEEKLNQLTSKAGGQN
ncbi:MAG: Mut7-C RNAse domain-containing protein [Dehalococcoidia bacterium]|nr:Mut7-C RNAse domain-containing protein [Dehalococcoidia bacterium]